MRAAQARTRQPHCAEGAVKIFFTFVIGFNETDKELYYYDIDGYVVYKTKVSISEHVQVHTDGQERILFFDPSTKSVWF